MSHCFVRNATVQDIGLDKQTMCFEVRPCQNFPLTERRETLWNSD